MCRAWKLETSQHISKAADYSEHHLKRIYVDGSNVYSLEHLLEEIICLFQSS